jgi:hypothetical protein
MSNSISTLLLHNGMKPQLAVDQRQVAEVFAVAEPAHLLLIIRLCVLVPKDVEGAEQRLGGSEKQVAELRFSVRIEANDLAIEKAIETKDLRRTDG